MKHAIILVAICATFLGGAASAAPPAAPLASKPICVEARRGTEYNARPIGQHDVLIQNAVGDRRPLRLETTCIHIYPDALVAVHSSLNCVGMGDDVSVRTIDGQGERCRVSKVTPLAAGSIQAPYK